MQRHSRKGPIIKRNDQIDHAITLDNLRHFAISRTLFPPTTLARAVERLGFVQADPIRAPARAQDLTLRHRVANYRAGDLERGYATHAVEEDTFINYGYLPRAVYALMQPRAGMRGWARGRKVKAQMLLDFVRERGTVHPREVNARFAHGTVTNYWGGSSTATTHLLEHMHYEGLLRVARREAGVRIYAAAEQQPPAPDAVARRQQIDALVDVVVSTYAPLPAASLLRLVSRLRYAVPQWRGELRAALPRARARLSSTRIDNMEWYWPAGERVADGVAPDTVRLLAPFDPVVWDRWRFELLWGWAYRFEAYTPVPLRKLGYYALPLLWRERVIGWANIAVANGGLVADIGYVASPPRERAFKRELAAELDRMRLFLRPQIAQIT
jgi:uncharacterized protein